MTGERKECLPVSQTLPRRHVLTLLEVLIVLVIVAIFLALFLVARQKVCETAHRSQCKNNLKQLVLAIHNYADTYSNKLPALYSAPVEKGIAHRQSFFLTIIPYIEANHMYRDALDNASPPGLTWTGLYNGAPIFSAAFMTTFACPGDPTNSTTQPTACGWVGSSYAANYQVFGTEEWRPKYTIGNIPDGTANTAFLAERFAQYPGPPGQFTDPDGKVQQAYTLWAWPANYPPNPPTSYTSPVPQNAAIFAYSNLKTGEGYGDIAFSLPQIDIRPQEADYRLVQSGHTGLVQFGVGDGSVRAVITTIRQSAWQGVLIPDDGLGLGDDW
jgi:hypothetical protein